MKKTFDFLSTSDTFLATLKLADGAGENTVESSSASTVNSKPRNNSDTAFTHASSVDLYKDTSSLLTVSREADFVVACDSDAEGPPIPSR